LPVIGIGTNRFSESGMAELCDRLFLATKFTNGGGFGGQPSGKESFERSLQRLQSDHLDLLHALGADHAEVRGLASRGHLRNLGQHQSRAC